MTNTTVRCIAYVLSHDITDSLHYKLQHDLGIEEKSLSADSGKWYGVNQYLTYDVSDKVGVGTRLEWFRDEDGIRVNGNKGSFSGRHCRAELQAHVLADTAPRGQI